MPAISDAIMSLVSNVGAVTGICILVGLGLVILEIFIPGFGIPGITGTILLVISILLTANSMLEILIMLLFFLVIIAIPLAIMIRLGKKGKLSRGIILESNNIKSESCKIENKDMEYFIGKRGKTKSMLRPAGKIDLDGVMLDAVTEGAFIEVNKEVEVIKVDGIRIVVKEIEM